MTSGKIVIGSNVPGVKDILVKFPECLFEPSDIKSLRDCIASIMSLSDDGRYNLGEKMKAHVNSEYVMERFIDDHANLYKKVVQDF